MVVGSFCDGCAYKIPKIGGWRSACEAYPEGIPDEILFSDDAEINHNCKEGYGYKLNGKLRNKK